MAQRMRFGLALALGMAWAAAVSAQTMPATPGTACASAASGPAGASRIVGDWRTGAAVALPAAKAALPLNGTDMGVASPGARLERMLLLLEPAAAQRSALESELEALQSPGSCTYHRWLTAAQFADAYANSAADVAAVAAWLRGAGFTVAPLPAGRGWIEFSGTAGQVEQAFGAPVHALATAGGTRYFVRDAVSVPAALAPLIQGLVSLDGAVSALALTSPEAVPTGATAASLDAGGSAAAVTPNALAALLGLDALHAAGTLGTGQQIAIAVRSDVNPQDVAAFRSTFCLPANALQVVAEGADPGITQDQAAATAMASWAGAAAPGAQVVVVPAATTTATDGVDLSLAAIVDRRLGGIAVVGSSACEPELSAAHQAYYGALYRQAAAEGISVVAASGDSGGAACHAAGSDAPVTTGYAVNGLASTPWNTVAGVAASDGSGALRAWSAAVGMPGYSSGGGVSAAYALPAWQPALPANGNGRLLPDVALPAAGTETGGLAFCMSGTGDAASCTMVRSGGSAMAAAIFGGVAALLDGKDGAQGNLSPGLYALRSHAGVFADVQEGSAKLACAPGTPGCEGSGQLGYDAASGYDLATGLGSVHADKLLSAWASPQSTGTGAVTVTLTVVPPAANSTYNPTAQITFTASVGSLTGGTMPTGTVQFFDQSTNANLGAGAVTLATDGTASLPLTSGLALGGNNIVATYSGDSNYESLASGSVTVTTQASSTAMTITLPSTTPTVDQNFTATATLTVGTPAAGAVAPTGKVTLNLDGAATTTASLATTAGATTASFTVMVPTGGTHTLQAIYGGDPNYSASTSTPVSLTLTKGVTVTTVTATPPTLTAGIPETVTATVAPLNGVAATYTITGTVSFYDGTKLLGTEPLAANTATMTNVNFSTATTHQITAVYSGDTNWETSTSTALALVAILLNDTVTLTVSPANPAPGQAVTLAATVSPSVPPVATAEQNPTGNVVFYNGTTVLGSVALTASLNYASVATLLSANLPGGQAVLTAVYAGDQTYEPGTSNSIALDVHDFSLTPGPTNPPTNLNIVKGQAGAASFVVTGLGGFGGQVQVVCSVPGQDDMTCAQSPQQVVPNATVAFTIQTFTTGGPASAMNHKPMWRRAAGGVAFAALFLLVLPGGKRRRILTERAQRLVVLALLLAGVCGAGIGCQSISGTLASSQGTPLGVVTLTITATSYINNVVISHSLYLTVNVIPPG